MTFQRLHNHENGKSDFLNPDQCRAARALIDWTVPRVARNASLTSEEVRLFERNAGTLNAEEIAKIRSVFENAGVLFVDQDDFGPGVRERKIRNRNTTGCSGTRPGTCR